MTTVKITAVGNSVGVFLPKELLAKMRAKKGDLLHVIETPNGIELSPYDPGFEKQIEISDDIMHENLEKTC